MDGRAGGRAEVRLLVTGRIGPGRSPGARHRRTEHRQTGVQANAAG